MSDEMSALTMEEKKEFFAAEDEPKAPEPMMLDNWNDEQEEQDFKLSTEEIAQIAYSAIYNMQQVLGGTALVLEPYEILSLEMQSHIISKANYFIAKAANPNGYEECAALHDLVLSAKLHDGWRYGMTLNEAEKIGPDVMPYRSLALHIRSQDYLFRSVVIALLQCWRGH